MKKAFEISKEQLAEIVNLIGKCKGNDPAGIMSEIAQELKSNFFGLRDLSLGEFDETLLTIGYSVGCSQAFNSFGDKDMRTIDALLESLKFAGVDPHKAHDVLTTFVAAQGYKLNLPDGPIVMDDGVEYPNSKAELNQLIESGKAVYMEKGEEPEEALKRLRDQANRGVVGRHGGVVKDTLTPIEKDFINAFARRGFKGIQDLANALGIKEHTNCAICEEITPVYQGKCTGCFTLIQKKND
jgi:hypothetical protein